MRLGFFEVILACLLKSYVICAEVFPELVVLHDLNSDHLRRNLDAGLAPLLEFNMQRRSGDVKLTLKENKRLNPNAPVYEIKKDVIDGMKTLVKKKHIPIEEKFYHDKANRGAFVVRCELSANGPCRRMLTGSLHLSGKYYDLVPAPEAESKRGLDNELFGTSHNLIEIEVPKERIFGSSDVPDVSDVMPTEEPPLHNADFIQPNILLELIIEKQTLYDVEIFVVADQFVYKRFFDDAAPTDTLNREEVTELNIRRYFSLIVNGVSLRYEAIEDPDLHVFCTVSGFLIVKEKDEYYNLPEDIRTDEGGYVSTSAGGYLSDFRDWLPSLRNPPDFDHALLFTGSDITTTSESGEISYGVAGMAYVRAACTGNKVSVNEAFGSFFTTSLIAAHELGHNLGSDHDGEGASQECAKSNQYIMSYLAYFYDTSAYNINPWRFSRCSVRALKKYIGSLGSNNCLLDQGDVYDQAEYEEHARLLPGERYDLDAQCRLIQGKDSKLCESTDMSNICLVIKCLSPDGACKGYTAARGTRCGENKWCIDGGCISKAPEPEDTTCTDKGYAEHTCSSLRKVYRTMADFCHTWNISCCKTCKKHMGCWDGTNSKQYSGYVSWTKNGRTCQPWSSQEPHEHTRNTDSMFPLDDSVADAGNNCRDPDDTGSPWCYTTNEDVRWEFCAIPICNVDCYPSSDAKQYKGNVSKISDGTQCQAWSEQTPHTHSYNQATMFPNDASVLAANNYCRDPSNDGRPWCYTVSTERWDWCPVPSCS